MGPVVIALFLWSAAQGGAPPPSPATAPPAAAGRTPSAPGVDAACTRATLLSGVPCRVEGRSPAAPASRARAADNRRAAAALADELCDAAARTGLDEADAAVLAACRQRTVERIGACGGDGSRPLTDESGRFNPGLGRCYAALAGHFADAAFDADTALSCCPCASACGTPLSQCLQRSTGGGLGSCVAQRCASPCAAALLRGGLAVEGPAGAGRKP